MNTEMELRQLSIEMRAFKDKMRGDTILGPGAHRRLLRIGGIIPSFEQGDRLGQGTHLRSRDQDQGPEQNDHYRSQHDGEQQVVALEPVPGKAVTRSSGEEEAEQHGEHGHDEAVEKVVGKIEVGELGEYVPVGVSVPPTRMAGVRYAR